MHVVLHQRENTDLTFHPPEAMRRTMDAHNVERAVVLPINHPDDFPLKRKDPVDADPHEESTPDGSIG